MSKRLEVYFLKQLKSRLNALIKLVIHFIGSILFKPFIGKPDFKNLDPLRPYKILCVCLAYRGDLVVIFPALNALKKRFPNSQITCWLREYNIPLARLNPDFDDVITYGDSARSSLSLFSEFLGGLKHSPFLTKIKGFDIYIDDSGYSYSALAGYRSKIPYRIGRNFQGFGFLNHHEVPLDLDMQLIERRLKLLKLLGIDLSLDEIPKPYMEINSDLISNTLHKFGISDSEYCVVQPFAGWKAKNWGIDKYCQVVGEFSNYSGLMPVFIGSKDEHLFIEESIIKNRMNAINIAGLAELDQTAAVIAGAKLYFGSDSIGSQLAIALGTRSLTIFGPTNPNLTSYLGQGNIGIRKITRCTPKPDRIYCCINAGRNCRHLSCMKDLRQEDVLETLKKHWAFEDLPPVVEF